MFMLQRSSRTYATAKQPMRDAKHIQVARRPHYYWLPALHNAINSRHQTNGLMVPWDVLDTNMPVVRLHTVQGKIFSAVYGT